MRKLKLTLLSGIMFFCALFSLNAMSQEDTVKPDVRVLIDISGSMKKNDPNNLRVPALQLVANLLPKDADAGVWAFGRYVNMMVPLGKVDAKWQSKATQTAKKINSAGLYTNIGGVLEKASYGWNDVNLNEKRSLILLTDGMVDISKSANVNAKERARILEKVLPKLKQGKVAVHTIALSQNADHELLKTLSTETDGWYQAVDNAEDLQKVFLKIFEQSAPRDSLPLTNNKFMVDASIEEMTLLVFKGESKKETKLVSASKKVLEKKSLPDNMRWFSTQGYDLITVEKPEQGEWQIDADVDPDNRVMVVSDLSLQVSPVPNNLLAGEAIDYSVGLLEEGKIITKMEFLKLVKAQLIQSKNEQTNRLSMFFDSGDHHFKQNFFTDSFEGVLNLQLLIKSPTFERTRNHAVNIYGSPLIHEVAISESIDEPHQIKFTIREDIVKKETLSVSATIQYPDGEKQFVGLDDLSKKLELKSFPLGGEYKVSLDVKGKSLVDRDFSVSPLPITFNAPALVETAKETVEEPVEEKTVIDDAVIEDTPKTEEPKVETPEISEEPDVKEPPKEESNFWFWIYVGLGVNIFLGVGGFFVWKLIKKKQQQGTQQVANELEIDDSDEDVPEQDIDKNENNKEE